MGGQQSTLFVLQFGAFARLLLVERPLGNVPNDLQEQGVFVKDGRSRRWVRGDRSREGLKFFRGITKKVCVSELSIGCVTIMRDYQQDVCVVITSRVAQSQ